MAARFRSGDDRQFESAFFELYLYSLLRDFGYEAEPHPALEGVQTRPDFLVRRAGLPQFLLEATVATDKTEEEWAADQRLRAVYDALNKVNSPHFFVSAWVDGDPATPVPGRKLRAEVEGFVASLRVDEVRAMLEQGAELDDLPSLNFQHDDWTVRLSVMPKSPRSAGQPGIRPLGMHGLAEAQMVDDRKALRAAIIDKAGRYGQLNLPYFIAVNATNQFLDTIDVMEALFGREQFVLRGRGLDQEPTMRRQLDGA